MISHNTVISDLIDDIKVYDPDAYCLISGSNEFVVFYDIHFSMIWIETKKDILNCIKSHKYVRFINYEGTVARIAVPKAIIEFKKEVAEKEKEETRDVISSNKEQEDEGVELEEEQEEEQKDSFEEYIDNLEYGYLDDDD